jgi:hypothetical protein
MSEKMTIGMTGRAPVKIDGDAWIIIAEADEKNGETDYQASRWWEINVRRNNDGRAIVYGQYDSVWQGDSSIAGGELVAPGDDIVAAIIRVGETIGASVRLVDRCIGELPAEDI